MGLQVPAARTMHRSGLMLSTFLSYSKVTGCVCWGSSLCDVCLCRQMQGWLWVRKYAHPHLLP